MRKDEASLFIMRTRVLTGWVEPQALAELEAEMAAEQIVEELDLTEEERALMSLGELGSDNAEGGDDADAQSE